MENGDSAPDSEKRLKNGVDEAVSMQSYYLHKSDADAPIIFLLSGDEDGTKVWDTALRLAKGIALILEGTRT